ncbi:hypothetical protein ANRL4_01503 [Anaerolineae bacterium]|nr:hypothetical protein ANRL4_01503 [Anaerolineae bacterium]
MIQNMKRLPILFDLNNPQDAALWAALEPFVKRRRGSQFIRDALKQAISSPIMGAPSSVNFTPTSGGAAKPSISLSSLPPADPGADYEAVDSFLEAFA